VELGLDLEAFLAIDCLTATRGPRLTAAEAEAALPEFERAAPQFGPTYATQLTRCASWPVRPNQFPHRVTARGAAPILVVGTTRDPATPYEQARSLTRQLDSARLLTWDADGHGAYLRGSACVDAAVDRYLIEGALPAAGTVCR
jgi:pimeloyl-ACP methyl ester carboxylesterase